MKIRIFALAKELGIDSKDLIEYASEAGVTVKNSALASVTPEERDAILKHVEERGDDDTPTEPDRPAVPTRDANLDVGGKVRTIEARAPKPPPTPVAAEPAVAAPEEGNGVVTAEEPAVETAAEEESEQPAESETELPAAASDETEATAESDSDAATEASDDSSDGESEAASSGPEAIRPSDYVPPAGATGGGIREMVPRGTVPNARPKKKQKPRQQLPNIASASNYVPPKPKVEKTKDQTPAQKPDIPLTAAELRGGEASPLRGHMKQNRKRDQEDESAGKRGSAKDFAERTAERARRRTERRRRRFSDDDDGPQRRMPSGRRRSRGSSGPVELKSEAEISPPITIRTLSEATGRPARVFQSILFNQGEMITINDSINEELALELAMEVGVELTIKHGRDIEEELQDILQSDEPEDVLVERPPVITILGHVDHGKTSLLDKIRSANVAGGEAGGITQHIASYQVEHDEKKVTFVDTPGHAAFGEMRARGAGVTDIIVLVVAADDGVMPQTVECIAHAKAAEVPIVVAMNKIDLPDANEQKVLQGLAAQDLLPAEWGGEVEVVRTSAETGQGLDDLLETLLVTAELHEYKANADRDAVGVCLEAFMDEGLGPLAWFIVQRGTLRVGDVVLCGEAHGRIRAIYNDRNEEIQEAGPSTPITVAGLDVVPGAGDHFFVLPDIEEAREVAVDRHHKGRAEILATRGAPRTIEDILNEARGGKVSDLPLIIKADTPGSLEAIRGELDKFEHPEVRVQVVHEAVGGVNESDVSLASASGAIIVAFHVIAEDRAAELAEREGVEIRRYRIIYELTAHIKNVLEGLLEPEKVEVMTGRALVLQTFKISRFGTIAGCRVLNGTIERNNRVHVIRDQTVINDYNLASLRREKEDVREVREGMECGIRLDGFNDVKEGDLFEAFRVDEVKRTFD